MVHYQKRQRKAMVELDFFGDKKRFTLSVIEADTLWYKGSSLKFNRKAELIRSFAVSVKPYNIKNLIVFLHSEWRSMHNFRIGFEDMIDMFLKAFKKRLKTLQ